MSLKLGFQEVRAYAKAIRRAEKWAILVWYGAVASL